MQQNHTIKKFSVELQMAAQQNGYALQRRCVNVIKEDVMLQIDSVLSAHFSTGETVLINRIEIDLGTIKADDLEKDFTQKCITAFSSKIKKIKTGTALTAADINITDEVTANIKQFLYFLATGKMPWASTHIIFSKWLQAILSAIIEKKTDFRQLFSKLFAANEAAPERFINQFDDEFIAVVINLYTPDSKNNFVTLSALLRNTIPANYLAAVRKYLYKAILFYITGASKKTAAHYLPGVQAVLKNIPAVLISAEMENRIIAGFAVMFKINSPEKGIVNTAGVRPSLQPITNGPAAAAKMENENAEEKYSDIATYITNAGIILLHPYLKTLFTTAGLLNEDDFKDDYCKQKAVHLLQYAATGQMHLPEYMLALNKLLCAVPDDAHIDRFVELTADDEAMVKELLQAVISNWAILGNTSVEALQETFLQRKAKLVFNKAAGHWQLHVERTGLDVLLDKIPWGFAYIKLPWMPQALLTEW